MIAILMVGFAGMILVTGVFVGHALKTHVYDIRDRRLAQHHHEVRLREAKLRQFKIGGPDQGV